jgi:hypothetical protein
MGDGSGRCSAGDGQRRQSRVSRSKRATEREGKPRAALVCPTLLPGLLVLGSLMGQKLKTCSLVTWATTRAMAWAALVLDPPMM